MKGKGSSQSTNDKSVVPARGKERERRSNPETASPALPQAPTLAKTRAGTKTLESAIQKITGLSVTEDQILEEEDRLLDGETERRDTPMDIQTANTEKKSLLAWRQAYKKTRCNLDRARSHLDFIRACMGNHKVPKGLQVKVQCNALLSDLTDVKTKFQHTKGMAEKEYTEALESHYVQLIAKLESELLEIEFHMAREVREASDQDKRIHDQMMDKTRENIEKLGRTLDETKKRKMEMLTNPPPEKRARETRESRKKEYGEQARYPRMDRPQQPRRKTAQSGNRQQAAPQTSTQTRSQPPVPYQPAPTTYQPNPQIRPQLPTPYQPMPTVPNPPPQPSNTELSIASLLNQLVMQGMTRQQPPTLLQTPCAVGPQPPMLPAPTVSVVPGQPPPLSGHYQQGFHQ